jgi:hypothetical protein
MTYRYRNTAGWSLETVKLRNLNWLFKRCNKNIEHGFPHKDLMSALKLL